MTRERAVGIMAVLGAMAVVSASWADVPVVMSTAARVQGEVRDVDQSQRLLTLELPSGDRVRLKVDPAVTRLNDMKKGDAVTVDYVESVGVGVAPSG